MKKRKLLLVLVLTLNFITIYAQKGKYKIGEIVQKQYTDTLKVEIVNDAIIVNVEVGEKTYRFFLDTGAPTIFGTHIPGNFETVSEEEISDAAGNSKTVKFHLAPIMKIGNLEYENIVVMQKDIDVLKMFEADGILGANIMTKSVWDFDLDNKQIIVSNKVNDAFTSKASKAKIGLLPTGSPIVLAEHFGFLKEEIYIDFGFRGFYSMSNNIYKILSENNLIEKQISGEGELLRTAFGATDSIFHRVMLNSKIGDLDLSNVQAIVDYDEESCLGLDFLKYYRTVIDFKKKKLYTKPYQNKRPAEFKSYGILTFFNDSEMYVSFIWYASKAYKDGLRKGDKILSFNGIDIKDSGKSLSEFQHEIDALLAGNDEIRLEVNEKGNFIKLQKTVLLK